ncbi:Sterol uptake control protein 2 [Colletotrichum sp. SAR 10_98]|nr:Sterol uptake control protein 2 [Colletotrichum sp. SAR 10_98]
MHRFRSRGLNEEDIRRAEEDALTAKEGGSSTPIITHQPHHQVLLFSLQDMRFFQHFMLQCYPHHPIGNESIWTHEIPCLSQSHEFLMHAILGMAACDLMAQDPSLLAFAMAHRVKAIKAIKKSLAELPTKGTNTEHANALVATCFALTFQSTSFEDGMGEFMTFIRGILIIGAQMMCKGIKPVFVNMLDQDSRAVLEPKMLNLPLIRQEWADGAVEAIAYRMISKHYGWWIQLPHDKFQRVIDMSNMTMILLATHWIAAQLVMASVTKAEHECREKAPPKKETDNPEDTGSIVRWLRTMATIPPILITALIVGAGTRGRMGPTRPGTASTIILTHRPDARLLIG